MTINALFFCEVPEVELMGVPAVVTRKGLLAALPQVGHLIRTDDGRSGFDADDEESGEPGIRVVGAVHDIDSGTVAVYCRHIGGSWCSALDLISLDGWECEDPSEEPLYREECARLQKEEG
jgi:hypothetical protein